MAVERVLHHFPLDPASRQVRLVLGEKRLAFSEVQERYWEQRPEFLALNPAGKVPVLVVGGRPISEVLAILTYLARAYPEAGLLPPDPVGEAEVLALMSFIASTVHPVRKQGLEAARAAYQMLDDRLDGRDWALLVLLSVLWGGSFFFNGVILREVPPLTLVLLRVALAAIILLPLLRAYGISFPKGVSGWAPFFAIGLFNNVLPFSLIVTGQTYVPSGLASILNATTPLFTVIVMAIAGEETLHPRRVAGVIAGLIGGDPMGPDALARRREHVLDVLRNALEV